MSFTFRCTWPNVMPAAFGGASCACAGTTIDSASTEANSSLIDNPTRDRRLALAATAARCLELLRGHRSHAHDPHHRLLVLRAVVVVAERRVEHEAARFHCHHLA